VVGYLRLIALEKLTVTNVGTTGKPKGVDVTHLSVVNLLLTDPGRVGMRPGRRVAQLLNVAFDMAQWECLGSVTNGCTLCIRGSDWKGVMSRQVFQSL
jgi:non-ribosomal peptide synthetase component F